MNNMNDFWNGCFLGLTFNGNEVNRNGKSYCISENTPLCIIGRETSIFSAVEFLEQHGFNIKKTVVTDQTTENENVKKELNPGSVIVFADKRTWRQFQHVLNELSEYSLLLDHIKIFYNVFLPKLKSVYELLENDFSRDTYTAALCHRFKIFPRKILYPYIAKDQYFCIPQQMVLNTNEVFVDCGAYVGDTIEKMLIARDGIVQKIYAFEPYNKAFNAMTVRCKRLKEEWALNDDTINLVNAGCGSTTSKMGIITNESQMGSRLG